MIDLAWGVPILTLYCFRFYFKPNASSVNLVPWVSCLITALLQQFFTGLITWDNHLTASQREREVSLKTSENTSALQLNVHITGAGELLLGSLSGNHRSKLSGLPWWFVIPIAPYQALFSKHEWLRVSSLTTFRLIQEITKEFRNTQGVSVPEST